MSINSRVIYTQRIAGKSGADRKIQLCTVILCTYTQLISMLCIYTVAKYNFVKMTSFCPTSNIFCCDVVKWQEGITGEPISKEFK